MGGTDAGRRMRALTRPERRGWGRKRGPCLVTVKTSADTPPGPAAKIISASWGVHKHKRRAREAGPRALRASPAFSSSFFHLSLPLLLSFSTCLCPSLHAAVFEIVCPERSRLTGSSKCPLLKFFFSFSFWFKRTI